MSREPGPGENPVITEYWLKHYCTDHCTLCGNSGVIDTRGARTAVGLHTGRLNWCICPNGQIIRHHSGGQEPDDAFVRRHRRW